MNATNVVYLFNTPVEMIGRYKPAKTRHAGFDGKLERAVPGTHFQFVRVRWPDGRETDADFYRLRSEGGAPELNKMLKALPLIEE